VPINRDGSIESLSTHISIVDAARLATFAGSRRQQAAVTSAARRSTAMQAPQTSWTKQFTLTQIVSVALAWTIAISALTAVTTLGITGDLPGQRDGAASAPSIQADQGTAMAQVAARKEARQELLELQASALATHVARQQMQVYYAHKEARQEANEQLRAELTFRAGQQETMRRYYERKEEQIDALP
jgi:hypothetical protein